MNGVWLCLRLVVGFGVVLAPGVIVARALGVRRAAAAVAWSLVIVFAALAVTFAVGASLDLTLALVILAGLAALAVSLRRRGWDVPVPRRVWMLAAGAVLGLLLWRVAGNVGGDSFFHRARRSSSRSTTSPWTARTSSRTAGAASPPSRCGTGSSPSSPRYRAPIPPRSSCMGRRCSPRLSSSSRTRPAGRCFGALFRPLAAVAAGVAGVAMAPGHGGAFTALALPRDRLAPAARPGRARTRA